MTKFQLGNNEVALCSSMLYTITGIYSSAFSVCLFFGGEETTFLNYVV